jgi:LacI family transcriptional regulator
MVATLRDVACKAGVSVSTVSRVLNRKSSCKFSEETKERVWAAAQTLGYVPNENARRLAVKSVELQTQFKDAGIGYLLNATPERFSDPFFAKVIKGIDESLTAHGIRASLSASCLDFGSCDEVIHVAKLKQLEGLIVVGGIPDDMMLGLIRTIKSVVWIGDASLSRFQDVDIVGIDYMSGMEEAVRHLVKLGHSEICFVTGESNLETGRLDAYKTCMENAELRYDNRHIQLSEFSVEGGYRAVRRLLERGVRPTAVIAASDAMAIGGIKAFNEDGYSVPRDVSIVGFDDIDVSAYIEPSLTTVRIFKEEIGKAAVKLLMDRLYDNRQLPYKLILPVELVIRKSTTVPQVNFG